MEYDICIHCGAPGCSIKSITPQHTATCPETLNLWPVDDEDMLCFNCEAKFNKGEYYVRLPTEMSDVVIIVCTGCSILLGNLPKPEDFDTRKHYNQ